MELVAGRQNCILAWCSPDNEDAHHDRGFWVCAGEGLLDVLGFEKAHVVGASMGGAIAQTMAIELPDRVRSLISMMSTTGNISVGQPSPEALRDVFAGPPAVTRDEVIQRMLRAMRAVGSPGFPGDANEIALRA